MGRDLSATVGDAEHIARIEPEGAGRFRVSIDDVEHLVDAVHVDGCTWSLIVDGRSHLVDVDRRGERTVILAGGAETPVDLVDARRKALAEAVGATADGGTGEVLTAPIAGRVVKLLVEPGADVASGAGVIVLEAMKMENELKASRGGQVAAIHVEAGQSVETGEKLVTLE